MSRRRSPRAAIQKAARALDKAYDALEPFSWHDPQSQHGGGLEKLRSEINQALTSFERQIKRGEGWMWNVDMSDG